MCIFDQATPLDGVSISISRSRDGDWSAYKAILKKVEFPILFGMMVSQIAA